MMGVLLDYNGVICRADDFFLERTRRMSRILGIKWTQEFMKDWKNLYTLATSGKISLGQFYTLLSRKHKFRMKNGIDASFARQEKIIPEIRTVLKALHRNTNVKVALVSNYVDKWVNGFLRYRRIEGYFDAVIVSSKVKSRKPSARIFRIASRRIGIPLKRCIYIGDSSDDLVACRKLGIIPYFIPGEEKGLQGFERIANVKEILSIDCLQNG
jgi:HAD superfamily hydrolase (TIGR01549 family)